MAQQTETLANERIVYLNGDFIPESNATVHIHDYGFTHGDGVFDTARTFAGEPFLLEEHIKRLFRSLRYVQIDPGLSPQEFIDISREVIDRNRHLLGPGDDYWVFQRISRGSAMPDGPGGRHGPTVAVTCVPLPLAARAKLFRDGIEVVIPSVRRTSPQAISPAAKTHNYLNLIVAGKEHAQTSPDAWPILLDDRGFLTEGSGSNLFLVRDGAVRTPKEQYVLPGLSRQVVKDLCVQLDIPCTEDDLASYDGITADEAFITSTSLCMCHLSRFNGVDLPGDGKPGPITQRLIQAYREKIGTDFVAQYLDKLAD